MILRRGFVGFPFLFVAVPVCLGLILVIIAAANAVGARSIIIVPLYPICASPVVIVGTGMIFVFVLGFRSPGILILAGPIIRLIGLILCAKQRARR